jgi:hypothetical protein
MRGDDWFELVIYVPASLLEITDSYLTAKLVEKGYLTAEVKDHELGEVQDQKRPVKIYFTKE